jgi:cytoskeletal protein CcmA (bactofilin family)
MFRRKHNKSIEVTKLSSLIADNLEIVGDVHFSGGLRIDGKVEGNVLGKEGERSLLVLSSKGTIVGRVRAYDAVINGVVSGDLEIEHFVELQDNARVSGNITYRQLQLECGAVVAGRLQKTDEPAEDHKVIDISAATAIAARAE